MPFRENGEKYLGGEPTHGQRRRAKFGFSDEQKTWAHEQTQLTNQDGKNNLSVRKNALRIEIMNSML